MIEIDGKQGGGQILRTGIGLSALVNKPCKIINIRRAREKPGLKEQHLQGVNAIAKLCDGKLKGAEIGSHNVEFYPGKIKSGEISVNIGTAGSIGLVLQALLIPALKAERGLHIKIKGGATFGKWAPPTHYLKLVLFPLLEKIGYACSLSINRHGFYPKGGADVEVFTKPVHKLKSFNLTEQEKVTEIYGISIASSSLKKANVAERQQKSAREILFKELGTSPNIKVAYVDSICPGSGIVLIGNTNHLGSDSLGERGKPAEKVGKEAAEELVGEIKSGAVVDYHFADNLIPYIGWISANNKESCSFKTSKISNHIKTNIRVTEQFLPVKFEIEGNIIKSEKR